MDFLQALEPWMIPIVVMICVTLIVAISVVGNIITTSMKKKGKNNLSENKEFLDALRDFKENIDRRVANLENIAASEKPVSSSKASEKENPEKQSKSAIELGFDDDEPSREEEAARPSKLRNMLNQ